MTWLTGLGIWIATRFMSGIKWISLNPRLVIEYCLIGAVVVMGGFTTALWIKKQQTEIVLADTKTTLEASRGERALLTTRLSIQEDVNDKQSDRIESLVKLRTLDSTALTALVTNLKQLAIKDSRVQKKLTELENKNAAVKDYLDQPIPPNLTCLHNDECEKAESGDKDSQGDENPDS